MGHHNGHRSDVSDGEFEMMVGNRIGLCRICKTSVYICVLCREPIPAAKVAILPPPFGNRAEVLKTVLHLDPCYKEIVAMVRVKLGLEKALEIPVK
jgi:hypothetical protein